jgi:hypothetical protein
MAYGTVTIGGKTFIQKEQSFSLKVTTAGNQLQVRTSLVLPGTADFWLKALMRETLVNGVSTAFRFLFRLGNSDGSTWYQSGGTGGTTDLVLDTLLFGNGQFPFVLDPYIYYGASSSILINYQPLTNDVYDIYFSFRGAYLLPTQ